MELKRCKIDTFIRGSVPQKSAYSMLLFNLLSNFEPVFLSIGPQMSVIVKFSFCLLLSKQDHHLSPSESQSDSSCGQFIKNLQLL